MPGNVRGAHTGRRGNIIKFCSHEFYTAIMDEDVKRIEGMLEKYGSNSLIEIQGNASGDIFWKVNATTPASFTITCKSQHINCLFYRDQLGRTPLHLVITGWPSILITWPKPDSKFQTAVMGMCRQAEDCLRTLCENGGNINAKVMSFFPILNQCLASFPTETDKISIGQSHHTALHLSVPMATKSTKTLEDGISCISELLESGAEPNAVNKAGMTPLQEACSMGNKELVDLLLRYGANINKLSKAGENCLFLFLNQRSNVRHSSLLLKLLSLTSPLTVYDQTGRLPSTLMQPCFTEQRNQLLKITHQPRRLQDICKSVIYLKHVRGKTEELKKHMPERLYDFVFNRWENIYVSFVTDDKQGFLKSIPDINPS
uniref:Ankyrin repeat domain 61 n=1 Tax=Acanthochromis polyacanthus TaxID=80966 RepID=A0A3Q1G3G7_9TELE